MFCWQPCICELLECKALPNPLANTAWITWRRAGGWLTRGVNIPIPNPSKHPSDGLEYFWSIHLCCDLLDISLILAFWSLTPKIGILSYQNMSVWLPQRVAKNHKRALAFTFHRLDTRQDAISRLFIGKLKARPCLSNLQDVSIMNIDEKSLKMSEACKLCYTYYWHRGPIVH